MEPSRNDLEALVYEKYAGDPNAEGIRADVERLQAGEPLAYVIGHIPFLGLNIWLDSRPLIPRPETEWWTEELITHIKTIYRSGQSSRVLDVCAGSGAIGLAILKEVPDALVAFGELIPEHTTLIQKNIEVNALDATRADIRTSDLFDAFAGERYTIIACNPPYVPSKRTLDASVTNYEPSTALYSGDDGLELIRHIASEAPQHLVPQGELWMECDIENIHIARTLLVEHGFTKAEIRTDPYGRERIVVAQL